MCVMRCSVVVCMAIFTPQVMFRHYQQVKSIPTSNKWLQSHSCRLRDVPVVTINRQCVELKGLSQIVLGAVRLLRVKTDILFCTEHGPLPSYSTGTAVHSTSSTGAIVSKRLLPLLQGLLPDRKSVNAIFKLKIGQINHAEPAR